MYNEDIIHGKGMDTPKLKKIKELIVKGYSRTQIAEELNVTRQDIGQLCLRHGLNPVSGYRAEAITEEQLKELINQGKSNKQMAEFFGVSTSSISKTRRKFNLSGGPWGRVKIMD